MQNALSVSFHFNLRLQTSFLSSDTVISVRDDVFQHDIVSRAAQVSKEIKRVPRQTTTIAQKYEPLKF